MLTSKFEHDPDRIKSICAPRTRRAEWTDVQGSGNRLEAKGPCCLDTPRFLVPKVIDVTHATIFSDSERLAIEHFAIAVAN
jgi:hypothetical protein